MIKEINLKLFLLLLIAGICSPGSALWCQTLIDADDPNIQYVGRVKNLGTKSPSFDWPGVYINAVFTGTSCSIRMANSTGNNYFDVFIDSQLASIVHGVSTQTVFNVASGLADTSHTIQVVKRNGVNGNICTFSGFQLDNGKTLLAPAPRPGRKIECIGDSLTVGYGSEMSSGTTGNPPDKENSYIAYGPVTARHFNADYMLTAVSGVGMARSFGQYQSSTQTISYYYGQTVKNEGLNNYTFSWIPDAVVIYLCTNDFGGGSSSWPTHQQFEDSYYNFVKRVRGNYPNAEIFCMYNSPSIALIQSYITGIVGKLNGEGDARVHMVDINHVFASDEKGSDGHYNGKGHQVVSDVLSSVMAPILGWSTDTSSPTAPPAVRDGTGADVDYVQATALPAQLSANWDVSTDTESGIAGYLYAIGTTPGGANISPYQLVSGSSVTKTGLTLTAGATYYFSVKAQNGAGLQSSAATSDGQYVAAAVTADTTPVIVPVNPEIHVYPNPCKVSGANPVKFRVPEGGSGAGAAGGEASIYTISGRLIRTLSGTTEISWDGKNTEGVKLARGIYIYKIVNSNGDSVTGKLVMK